MLMDVKLAYLITHADVPTEHTVGRVQHGGTAGACAEALLFARGLVKVRCDHLLPIQPIPHLCIHGSHGSVRPFLWTSHPCQGSRQAPGEPRMNPTDESMHALEGRAVLHALRGAERSSEANVVLSSHSSYAHVRG
jgi:hypothetical protein